VQYIIPRLLLRGLPPAILVCLLPVAQALDSRRAISQYDYDQWGTEEGFPGGSVNAIAETDGYLWIAAEKGLIRFDGKSFRLFNSENTPAFASSPVLGLSTDAEGGLWIRFQSTRLVRYRSGEFGPVSLPNSNENVFTAMGKGPTGDIVLTRPGGPLRYRNGKLEPIQAHFGHGRGLAISVAETADGAVWLGTPDAGLFRIRDGQESSISGLPDKINCLLAGDGSEVWAGTDAGLIHWSGHELSRDGVPPPIQRGQVLALARDRDRNLWVGTIDSLFRIDSHGSYDIERLDNRQIGRANAIFEDRNGDLWVGGAHGIERYRESVFLTYRKAGKRPLDEGGSIFVDSSGGAWVGPAGGGLSWLRGAAGGSLDVAALDRDVNYSIDGTADELWLGGRSGGLTVLRTTPGAFSMKTYTTGDGLAPGSVYAVHRNRDGSVWAGTLGGGVSRVQDGNVTTFTTATGLASNTIYAIEEGSGGIMWFATSHGLCSFAGKRWRTYSSEQGLPPGRINSLTQDSGGVLWIGTDYGPLFMSDERIRSPRKLPDSLVTAVLGIADDGHGSLWFATSKSIVRVSRGFMLGQPGPIESREFVSADGIPSGEGVRRCRSVVKDHLGRIWFSLHGGVSVVDPGRLYRESVPAIVHIQSIIADGSAVSMTLSPQVPAGRRRVAFGFVGLSLSAPERIRFKYRLDGFDHDWSDPASANEAAYTNLSPGPYHFRVIASNSEGLWNSGETTVAFQVLPLFWQTPWFRISALLSLVLLCVVLHRMRLRHVTKQLSLRFEVRLAERNRIAQDLHDTLLQGLLGASLQLYAAAKGVPAELPARQKLNSILELLRKVADDGRNAVKGLRSSEGDDDLEGAFRNLPEKHLAPSSMNFRVVVQGQYRSLNKLARDEIYRIGREALLNSFRHSQASNVELNIEYNPSNLRLIIRDDGCGIDAKLLRLGRDGHWGLIGMRERATRIDGQLNVRSSNRGGTEVELTIPGKVAFRHDGTTQTWGLSWRLVSRTRLLFFRKAKDS
jgi:signal transduction histidine kinase/ligand-binding sensor domain-containing protein